VINVRRERLTTVSANGKAEGIGIGNNTVTPIALPQNSKQIGKLIELLVTARARHGWTEPQSRKNLAV